MPIYEFLCEQCNTLFNFYSSRINTSASPSCPRCGKANLPRQISAFATLGKARQDEEGLPAGLDESRMEQAMSSLMQEAERMNADDPRQMAQLMRKFTQQTGVSLGGAMEEAIARMEAGEDPEQIEQEMGDSLGDDQLGLEMVKKSLQRQRNRPRKDETLYEL